MALFGIFHDFWMLAYVALLIPSSSNDEGIQKIIPVKTTDGIDATVLHQDFWLYAFFTNFRAVDILS